MSGVELLLEEDKAFIQRKGWNVDVVRQENHEIHVIIRNFQLSPKFTPQQVDVLIRLLPGYPDTALDMFWTTPEVLLTGINQKPRNTEVVEVVPGHSAPMQRWSRHMGVWRPGGQDNLESFYAAAMHKELKM
jgi:hypothetical protein